MSWEKSSSYNFYSLVNSELFPKPEFKEVPIVQVTEQFAQNFYLNRLLNSSKPTATLVQLRRILFGLGSSSYPKFKILQIIASLPDKSPAEIVLLIGELRLEWMKLSSPIAKEADDVSCTIVEWGELLSTYNNGLFKSTLQSLAISIEESKSNADKDVFDSPQKIKLRLEEYFVGSDDVKTTLSRIFYEHNLSIQLSGKQILPKRNLLLLGPSGSGKSYIIRKLSEIVQYPIIIYDASKLTQRGIVGEKVEDTLRFLYNKTKSVEKMKGGVVFFDEIDKLAAGAFTSQNDVSTIGPQQDLLKFMEGDNYEFSASDDRYAKKDLKFNSSNLLIIAGGAFEGIEELISNRNKRMGFTTDEKNRFYDDVTVEDLTRYGLIKQLAARFQIITVLQQKTVENLIDILKNVKDSILKIYIDYFRFHECELIFSDDGIRKIAEIALEQNIGARGLVKILEQILPMYELGNRDIKNLIVDQQYINSVAKKI